MVHRRALAVVVLAVLGVFLLLFPEVPANSTNAAPISTQITYLPGQTHMNAPYSSGTTVGGVKCGPGVRQVSWSSYAPACEPAWSGDNGGATAPGVTGNTITVSYRNATASELQEIYTVNPPSITGTNEGLVRTMEAYINTFNKTFELYGRKVVFKPYDGQGNFINEDSGDGGPQAQADAVTAATSLHAFADISSTTSTFMYAQDLSKEKVINFGNYLQDEQWYQQNAPYAYTPGPNCTKSAQAIGALIGQQLQGPAQFAKGALKGKPRKFGLIYENSDTQAICEQQIVQAMGKYGVQPAVQAALTFSFATLTTAGQTIMAKMKAAGVTTIISVAADSVTPRFYMASASEENYYPEWFFQPVFPDNGDDGAATMRLMPASQAQDIISIGMPDTADAVAEGIKAYDLGNTETGQPIVPEYLLVYGALLQFFTALQEAGPNLTPQNFQAAMKAIPQSSPDGELGGWNGSTGPYDPASTFEVLKYDVNAINPADGKKGTWETCNEGNAYSFDNAGTELPKDTQLSCKVEAVTPKQVGTVPQSSESSTTPSGGSTTSAGSR